MDLSKPWTEYTFVAFDTETSGAWPVGCDVVEFGAVKWSQGKEVDHLQLLLKPREPMSDFIIGIHGITNEMVADAPLMSEKISVIRDFFEGAIPMAHHAPFDMGFMAIDFEAARLSFPREPVLCTSLLARKLIHGTPNHKLQTLVQFLGIDGGSAHRALDDARSCLMVGLECLRKLGPEAPLSQAFRTQEKDLRWENFRVLGDSNPLIQEIVRAIREKDVFQFVYDKGSDFRGAKPLGLVKSPDGDFIQARCLRDQTDKRFYLKNP